MTLRIYHNPHCSKSRRTLDIIREHGIEPDIVHYLDEMPDAGTLLEIARMLGTGIGPMLRHGESEYREAKDRPAGDDRALAEWLSRHPRLLQRPVVVDAARARAVIGRPPENVLGLLDQRPASR